MQLDVIVETLLLNHNPTPGPLLPGLFYSPTACFWSGDGNKLDCGSLFIRDEFIMILKVKSNYKNAQALHGTDFEQSYSYEFFYISATI